MVAIWRRFKAIFGMLLQPQCVAITTVGLAHGVMTLIALIGNGKMAGTGPIPIGILPVMNPVM